MIVLVEKVTNTCKTYSASELLKKCCRCDLSDVDFNVDSEFCDDCIEQVNESEAGYMTQPLMPWDNYYESL